MRSARCRSVGFAALVALCAWVTPALAAQWPQKPIRMLVGFAPGGGVDQLARTLSVPMSRTLGQPIVIDNRPGAATTIAAAALARARPDGYTVMLMSSTNAIAPALFKSLPYHPLQDFDMISLVASGPIIIAVANGSPIRSVEDVVARSRNAQGGLNYGAGGMATSMHLAALLMEQELRLPMTHIAYKGGSETTVALLSDQIDMMFVSPPTLAPVSERTRAIVVTSAKRFAGLPDVPTLAETLLPGFDVSSWYALAAPRGTPDAILQQISAALHAALQDQDIEAKLLTLGVSATPTTTAQASKYLADETARWETIVRRAGLSVGN